VQASAQKKLDGTVVKGSDGRTFILKHHIGETFFIYECRITVSGRDTITQFAGVSLTVNNSRFHESIVH